MKKSNIHYFTLLMLLGFILQVLPVLAIEKVVEVSGNTSSPISLTEYVAVFEDSHSLFTFTEITTPEFNLHFHSNSTTTEAFNYGNTSSTYWLRLTLENSSNTTVERMLEISDANISSLWFYSPPKDNIIQPIITGLNTPFNTRPYKNRYFVFVLNVLPHTRQTYYLKVQSIHTLIIPIQLWTSDSFHVHERNDYIMQAWYFGLVTAMIVFNTLLFTVLRDIIYLQYVSYVTFFTFYIASVNGLGKEFLWPNFTFIADIASAELLYFTVISLLYFTKEILNTRIAVPKIDHLLKIYIKIYVLQLIICPFYAPMVINKVGILLHLTFALVILGVTILCVIKRQRNAYFFLLAFVTLFLGGLSMNLRVLGILPTNAFTVNGFQLGSAWEMLILAFALADRFNTLRKEKELAQTELVDNLKNTERILEVKVDSRTSELQILNRELDQKERYLRELIDNFPFMVWLKDTESRFLAVNQVLANNFGENNASNMLGKSDFDYSPKEMAENYRKDDLFILHSKQQKMVEEQIIDHLGQIAWFETFKAPVFDNKGNALGTVGFTWNITLHKQSELQLRENEKQLQFLVEQERQYSVEKSNFLAMLTHELKSPLASIKLALNNIQRSENKDIQKLSLTHIQSATYDISNITARCLQVDKLEQANSTVNLSTFSLDILIHEIIQDSNESERVKVEIFSLFLITSDKLLCRIILSNLLDNALKYSPSHSLVFISAQMTEQPAGSLISVVNEVGGADKPETSRVFEKYYRHSKAQRFRGTGLGLWLVRGIAAQLNGEVNYSDQHHDKVEFQLWLPQ